MTTRTTLSVSARIRSMEAKATKLRRTKEMWNSSSGSRYNAAEHCPLMLQFCMCEWRNSCFSNLVFIPLQRVHEAMNKPGVSAKLKDVLRQVSSYDNVPRKKAKFQVGVWRYHVILMLYYTLCDKVSFLHVLCLCRLNHIFFCFLLFSSELDEKQS